MLFDEGKSIELQTKKGRSIRNLQKPKILPHRVKMAENQILNAFSEIDPSLMNKRREATALYNCHGMTFACRRTGIYETEDIRHIITDDGYRKLSDKEVREGDIVLYYDADNVAVHSGIVIELNWIANAFFPRIMSKWGDGGGEYFHRVDNAPYRDVRYLYYREGRDD